MIGKKYNIIPVYKKRVSRILKTTAQCLYYGYPAKFLERFYLVICIDFLSQKITLLLKINPHLNLVTLLKTNCYQLIIKFTNILMMNLQ